MTKWPEELYHDELCSWRFGASAQCDCKLKDLKPSQMPHVRARQEKMLHARMMTRNRRMRMTFFQAHLQAISMEMAFKRITVVLKTDVAPLVRRLNEIAKALKST